MTTFFLNQRMQYSRATSKVYIDKKMMLSAVLLSLLNNKYEINAQ